MIETIIPCKPNGRPVEVNIYPHTNIESAVTIERTKRVATRKAPSGVVFTYEGGAWSSVSGRYTIGYDEAGLTECEHSHPMPDGTYCEGSMTHAYCGWQVWDRVKDDYIHGSPEIYESFKDALADIPAE